MKKAWIENERIRDVAPGNPEELYHPDVAKLYDTNVPDDAENGDGWVNGTLVKPVVPEPVDPPAPVVVPPKVSPVQFKLLFSPQERVAIKTSTDPVVQDFFEIVNDPRLTYVDLGLQSTMDAIGYLQSEGLLTGERAAAILTGTLV